MTKRLFTILFAALALTSCTLSMDEWAETDETRGYDEVEEVENDFFSLKYQYKQDTRSLTEGIQQYISHVEADSIIWFTDNIPQGWMPKQGGCVVANCCELFPMGLMGRVLSIEHESGMYRVTTTEATLEDCYEEFDLDLNTEVYTTPLDSLYKETEEDDEENGTAGTRASVQERFTRASTRAGEPDEVVIRDWTMFHDMQKKHEKNAGTRASLEDVYEEDVNTTDTKTVDIIIAESGADGPLDKLLKKKNKNLSGTLTVAHTTKTTMHKIVQLKNKREATVTETSTGVKLTGQVGFSKSPNAEEKKKNDVVDAMITKALLLDSKLGTYSFMPDNDEKSPEFSVEVPLGALPFGAILRVKPVIECSIGLYGQVGATLWFSADSVATDIRNGKKVVDKQKRKDPPSNSVDVGMYGNATFKGGAELLLGVGKKLGGKVAGVGAYVQATLDVNLNLGIGLGYSGDDGFSFVAGKEEALTITCTGKIGGKIVTAGLFGDITLVSADVTFWDGVTLSYHPKIAYPSSDYVVLKDGYLEHNIVWFFKDRGFVFSDAWRSGNRPVVGIFEKGSNPKTSPPVDIVKTSTMSENFNSKDKIKTNTEYAFTFKNEKMKDYDMIPGVTDGKTYTWYPSYRRTLQTQRRPNIEYDRDGEYLVYQEYGKETRNPYNPNEIAGAYSFWLVFTLRNAAVMTQYWDDWGVEYGSSASGVGVTYSGIPTMAKAWNLSKHVSLKDRVRQDGKYVVKVKFEAVTTSVNIQSISVWGNFWYTPKNGKSSISLWTEESWPYCYLPYTTNTLSGRDNYVRREIFLNRDYDDAGILDNMFEDCIPLDVKM